MPSSLPPNPFQSLYNKTALDLASESFDSVPVKDTDRIIEWIGKAAEGKDDVREPTVSVPLFETYTLSLLSLAKGIDKPKFYAPDWKDSELEDIAALLVGAALVRRARAGTAAAVAATEEGEDAAKRRGWKVVEDAIGQLKDCESELVELGESVLSGYPTLLQKWREDTDDGSFPDAASDVRRRLDIVKANEDKFKDTVVTQELRDRAEALHADAWAFYRGREGRLTSKTQLTLARDRAFTLLLERLDRLRLVLRAAYRGNAEVRQKIEGGYWRRLERLSMPRRKRKGSTTDPTTGPTE